MSVNIFVPVKIVSVNKIVNKFAGPGGWLLSLEDALNFSNDEHPWWVLTKGKMVKVRGRKHWQRMLWNSGCQHVIFLKARL